MSIGAVNKRLDGIEKQLSPREWAIQLADKMRQYPHEKDFWQAVVKEPSQECLLFKPLFRLDEQTRREFPGKRREDINERNELSQKLRTEFQQLKLFIASLNTIIKDKTQIIALEFALKASRIESLSQELLFCKLAQTAASWIRRMAKSGGEQQPEEQPRVLWLLRTFAHLPDRTSQIEPLSNDLVLLTKDALAHEASLQLAQARYFDGHPILFRNIEDMLKQTIQTSINTLEELNRFFSIRERAHIQAVRERPGLIDIEKIMKEAKATATLDILKVPGADRWDICRATMEEELKSALEAAGLARDGQ